MRSFKISHVGRVGESGKETDADRKKTKKGI